MSGKRILVVEDSPTERLITVSVCEKAGYKVITACDGEEAMQMTLDHRPDLILLDVILPKKNGFQVCRQIKSTPEVKQTKVIMVTSKSQDSDRFWGIKQGADGYLTKPFQDGELLDLIKANI
ncbi:MAG: response regulator [Desulfoprunum sp.]|jgi:twitching motility two-component system response regulator PilH|uniref:response regulator transcription factor n=1 Tax=Desulfoprunum sp. TaxID=2020866 RepID=UPI00052BDF09|nr:chemotaxis protein CheY [Desulfobulbus sp. Tol-SR]